MIKVGDLVSTNNWYFVADSPEGMRVNTDDATTPGEIYLVFEVEKKRCRIVAPGKDLCGWIEDWKLVELV